MQHPGKIIMTLEELSKFCSIDPNREHLCTPFNFNGRSIATDGCILISAPEIAGLDDIPEGIMGRVAGLLNTEGDFEPVPHGLGEGEQEAPGGETRCDKCHGAGDRYPPRAHVTICGVTVAPHYAKQVLAFPDLEGFGKDSALHFKSGEIKGILMGMSVFCTQRFLYLYMDPWRQKSLAESYATYRE